MDLPKRVFPIPYQVDFSVESKGRHLDSTKRVIKWKFGFAHPPSVFPHLHDENGNYIGDNPKSTESSESLNSSTSTCNGVECRGREHEIVLTWSLLTGKAKLWLDNKEIYRHEPPVDSIFNPFTASFHKGIDLPNPEFNGSRHIEMRCYARTPLGAKNMPVDDRGGTFRQYELTVDGLSFFAMPAMFELGTDIMWRKVMRWGLAQREVDHDEEGAVVVGNPRAEVNGGRTGRMVDEYYFNKKKGHFSYDQTISKGEKKAMTPRDETEEERMMRIAMEASMRDYENQVGKRRSPPHKESRHSSRHHREHHSRSRTSSEENYSSTNDEQYDVRKTKSDEGNKLLSVKEDENLIDFGGDDDLARGLSHVTISGHATTSDVSVLGDDDQTTASFMMNTGWNSSNYAPPQQPPVQPYANMGQIFQQQIPLQPHFNPSPAVTPRGMPPSDASFVFAPPPTLEDFNNAFGGGSIYGGSIAMTSPVASLNGSMPPNMQMSQSMSAEYGGAPQYSMNQQWQTQSYGAHAPANSGKDSKFDPLRADPFAS